MLNARNDLGTKGMGDISGLALAIVLVTLTILLLLARSASGQTVTGEFELHGTVVDGETGTPLVGAWVHFTGSEWGSVTDDTGRFRLPDLSPGPLSLTVEQLGYDTLVWEESVTADSEPELRLVPQPILLEGLAVVTDRFRNRRNAIATTVRAYDQNDLSTSAQRTAVEFVETRVGTREVSCRGRMSDRCLIIRGQTVEPVVYIDEFPVAGGLSYLETFAPHELYMIEVFARGRHIRAYTFSFMERAAKQRLNPIALMY